MPRRGPKPSHYQPLADYLANQAVDDITLTFTEIEAIIGTTLSVSAQLTSAWWLSRRDAHAQTWQSVGWHARFDYRGRSVRFVRESGTGRNPYE